MILYRISKEAYANDLTGEGARRFGGRWNSKGTPVLYTAISAALATLELLVQTPLNILPKNLALIEIDCPDNTIIQKIEPEDYPDDWNRYPGPKSCAEIGDEWCRQSSAPALMLPSVIIPIISEFNIILNPLHPDFKNISIKKISPYHLDPRLR